MSQIISSFIPELIVGKDYYDYMENIFPTLPILGEDKLSILDKSIPHADESFTWCLLNFWSGAPGSFSSALSLSDWSCTRCQIGWREHDWSRVITLRSRQQHAP